MDTDRLYVIKAKGLDKDVLSAAIILEGVLAITKPRLFIDIDVYKDYLDESIELIESDFFSVLEENRNEYSSNFITYSLKPDDPSINMAATIAAATGIPAIPDTLKEEAERRGFCEIMDLSKIEGSSAERQRKVFLEYRDKLSRDKLVHLVTKGNFLVQMRDFPISEGAFCFYTGESEEDKLFRKEVLEWAKPNIPIYGWTSDELDFVNDISKYGDYLIPCDWSVNHSYFSSLPIAVMEQKRKDVDIDELSKMKKHFVCIEVSDGDNAQWIERDFSTGSTFGDRLRLYKEGKGNYTVNWTFPPILSEFNPKALEKIYSLAENDLFVSGVSGAGYMNSTMFPDEFLPYFVERTQDLMKRSDLRIVTLLDNRNRFDAHNIDFIRSKIDVYASEESIEGGLWEMDPDRYEDGHGEMFFSSNGKPFVSVRFSLWHESNERRIDEAWLKKYADKVNSMPKDPTSPDGYSLINFHPWTMNMDLLEKFVSMLSEDIEIVDAETFIKLIKANVKPF